MELGIILAGFVMTFLAIRNHHRQVFQKLDDISKMLANEVEDVSDDIANEDQSDVFLRDQLFILFVSMFALLLHTLNKG